MGEERFTVVRGEVVVTPTTLGQIRAALPEDQRAAFDEEMYATPLEEIHRCALLGRALPAEAVEDEEAVVERVRNGDYRELVDGDGTYVEER